MPQSTKTSAKGAGTLSIPKALWQESNPNEQPVLEFGGSWLLCFCKRSLKKMLKKAVPVSSVLSSIAANHIKLYRKHDSSGEKNLKLLFNKRVKTDI